MERHFRLALCLGIAGAISSALVFPYLLALMPGMLARAAEEGVGLPMLVAAQVAQAFVVYTLMSWAGLRVGAGMGLDAPLLRALVYGGPRPRPRITLAWAVAIGICCAMAIVLVDHAMQPWMPRPLSGLPPAIERWKGFLASFYGGIGEEIQLRLFLMTLVMWAAWKVLARKSPSPPAFVAWIAIVLATLAFGAGHLPAAAGVWPLDAVVIARTLLLNGIAGIACGWLFYRHGLEHAIVAHFSADIVLHVAAA